MFFKLAVAMVAAAAALVPARAETHTVTITNNCGYGTPMLVESQNGDVLSTGAAYTTNGPLIAIAFLQTGVCGPDGENCVIVETTLKNGNSSTALCPNPPYGSQAIIGFSYYNGCDGLGSDCSSAICPIASQQPNDTCVSVECTADNVDLAITFCD